MNTVRGTCTRIVTRAEAVGDTVAWSARVREDAVQGGASLRSTGRWDGFPSTIEIEFVVTANGELSDGPTVHIVPLPDHILPRAPTLRV